MAGIDSDWGGEIEMTEDLCDQVLQFICPRCSANLGVQENEMHCLACGRVAVMKRGVWDFVVDDDYAASFARQWSRYSRTQLDSSNGTAISCDQFVQVTGWSGTELEGNTVLDAGCGSGRYSEVVLGFGARLVAMDLSEAAYTARENLDRDKGAVVLRGNLLHPPLAPALFDKVVSIGVLQHTPDPLEAARQLMQLVRPGGQLAIWMYERRWYTECLPKFWLRRVARYLSPARVFQMSRLLVGVFTPAARLIGSIRHRGLRRLLSSLLPIASYWGSLPLDRDQQIEWSLLDTHDWLSPTYDFPQRYHDLARALFEAGASDVWRRPLAGLTVGATRALDT